MDNRWCDMIEEQIKYLYDKQVKTNDVVVEIREKINNGFGDTLKETQEATKEIKDQINLLARTVGFLSKEVHKTPEERLIDCPFKKELHEGMERRIKIYIAVGGLLIAFISSIPSWIRLII